MPSTFSRFRRMMTRAMISVKQTCDIDIEAAGTTIDHTSLCRLMRPGLRVVTFFNHNFVNCTHTHPFNGPFSGTTLVSRYQKGKTNLDFTEARDSEWQWNPLGHMQICTSLQTDNHTSTPPLSFLQAGCPSSRPTNSVKAPKAHLSTAKLH